MWALLKHKNVSASQTIGLLAENFITSTTIFFIISFFWVFVFFSSFLLFIMVIYLGLLKTKLLEHRESQLL